MSNTDKIEALEIFMAADKYVAYEEWHSFSEGTDEEEKVTVNNCLNDCAGELSALLSTSEDISVLQAVDILDHYASEVSFLVSDTEDREFAHELLSILAKIIGVKNQFVAHMQNKWGIF